MRLIDADKLIELLNKKYGDDENVNESVFYLVGVISGMSTEYADDVVRCKDCRWITIRCERHGGFTSLDDYCLGGKKKDDNA